MDGFNLITTAAGTRWTDGCSGTPTLTLLSLFESSCGLFGGLMLHGNITDSGLWVVVSIGSCQ
jgi:hypothetical protein